MRMVHLLRHNFICCFHHLKNKSKNCYSSKGMDNLKILAGFWNEKFQNERSADIFGQIVYKRSAICIEMTCLMNVYYEYTSQ